MKILISSCLLGKNVKYSGGNNLSERLVALFKKYNVKLIEVCPEVLGGLSIPREASEISNGEVITKSGLWVSNEFKKGAETILKIALKNNIDFAVLKERSPSCGRKFIYDGTFSGKLIKGQGLSTQKLLENGIEVFSEENFEEIEEKLKEFYKIL
ncbi:MAG: DUF523 domain-containing protein [Fusobacterium sp.]|uniref:DUF523 domain-containing protein n=1 Tax=Fusobacterium sp. TaxID=68766 RepID=UPI0026DBE759|nr:DUF523 domain-containing protein [Fusobacterium sp.]MDO4691201.1 DUF523 domain-containing protein [Fusobacterium sp.]